MSARPARLPPRDFSLEEFIEYVKGHEDAEFKTIVEIDRKYKEDPFVYECG